MKVSWLLWHHSLSFSCPKTICSTISWWIQSLQRGLRSFYHPIFPHICSISGSVASFILWFCDPCLAIYPFWTSWCALVEDRASWTRHGFILQWVDYHSLDSNPNRFGPIWENSAFRLSFLRWLSSMSRTMEIPLGYLEVTCTGEGYHMKWLRHLGCILIPSRLIIALW